MFRALRACMNACMQQECVCVCVESPQAGHGVVQRLDEGQVVHTTAKEDIVLARYVYGHECAVCRFSTLFARSFSLVTFFGWGEAVCLSLFIKAAGGEAWLALP